MYVYIFVNQKNTFFKIGRTTRLSKRKKLLEKLWGQFDYDKSFVIHSNKEDSKILEKTLHYLISNYKYKFEVSENRNGFTEFFKFEAYNLISNFCSNTLTTFKNNITIKKLEK
jgi:hypothetical protein